MVCIGEIDADWSVGIQDFAIPDIFASVVELVDFNGIMAIKENLKMKVSKKKECSVRNC